jgi:hypothetical protein
MAPQPLGGLGRLIFRGFTITLLYTPHSVGLLWTSNQPVAETSTWKHSQQTDIHALGGIRTHNPSKRAAVDPRLRQRGHWDRLLKEGYRFKLLLKTCSNVSASKHVSLTVFVYCMYVNE